MNARPATAAGSPASPSWATTAAGAALACALAPWATAFTWLLPVAADRVSAVLLAAPSVSLVLAIVVLRATGHRPAGHARGIAWAAIGLAALWVLLLVGAILGLLLAY